MNRPEKVELTFLKPTASVGVPTALNTSPEPASAPHAVDRLFRS
jgi:hypothetical protein